MSRKGKSTGLSILILLLVLSIGISGYILYDLNSYDVNILNHLEKPKRKKEKITMQQLGYQSIEISNKHKAIHVYDLMKSSPGYTQYGIAYTLDDKERWFYIDLSKKQIVYIIHSKPTERYTWENKDVKDLENAMYSGYFGTSKKESF